jgi:XRE family transcriptional regulator, thiamine biosynthesis regulator
MSELFLPSVRQLVARQLRTQGMSQNRISSLLGVTQASVSVYLSSDPRRSYDSLASFNVSREDADRIAANLSSAVAAGPVDGVRALESVWTGLLGRGMVCDAHRAEYPSLAACDVCMVEYGRRHGEQERNVAEVSEAVKLLEGSPDFAAVMPEVSVNIASAAPGATSPADVVAVPGRVVKVRGRAKAMLPPEAGASMHMAKVLLLAMSRQPELRACINLRYDRRMEALLRREGLRTLAIREVPRQGVDDSTVAAMESRLKDSRGRFEALVDEGGSGIEPNLYLFAKGANEVAEIALRLARAYSARQRP